MFSFVVKFGNRAFVVPNVVSWQVTKALLNSLLKIDPVQLSVLWSSG